MRSGYDDEDHQIRINDNLQKRIYMPMFCRLSVKDVKLNDHYRHPISSGEPSSPKVTCIGQVKRNNRVTGYPSVAATVNHHHHHHNKPPMIKINKLFSSKTQLLPSTTAAKTSTSSSGGGGGGRSGSSSCRIGREMRVINSRRRRVKTTDCDRGCVVAAEVVDIGGMDPPLPVVKRVPPPEVNIWKRRFNGVGLQIEQIHLPNNNKFEPPPTTV